MPGIIPAAEIFEPIVTREFSDISRRTWKMRRRDAGFELANPETVPGAMPCRRALNFRERELLGRILVFHLQPLIRIERRQVVEIHLVTGLFAIFEIKRIDFAQREVGCAFPRAANVAIDVPPVRRPKRVFGARYPV